MHRTFALGNDVRVWKFEEGEGLWGVDEPQYTKAGEDGGIEACYELKVGE